MTEELWQMLNSNPSNSTNPYNSIHLQNWPSVDKKYLESTSANIVIQVNGKVRENILVDKNIGEEDIKKLAIESQKVQKFITGKEIKKTIYVPGKILNIVI